MKPHVQPVNQARAVVSCMNAFRCLLVLPALVAALSCDSRMPVTPSGPSASSTPAQQQPPRAADAERFEVSGVVTDDRGAPLVNANVTMGTTAAYPDWPSVRTDTSGVYRVIFSANTLEWQQRGRFVARAEVDVPGYELYWRNVIATTTSTLNENFRLQRIQRVVAGRAIVVSFASDVGDCPVDLALVCGTVRVTAPIGGNVTVDAVAANGRRPDLSACCASGNDVWGNPITLPAAGGKELEVRIALRIGGPNRESFEGQSFEVTTSVAPF
jgi:hypothetical protein